MRRARHRIAPRRRRPAARRDCPPASRRRAPAATADARAVCRPCRSRPRAQRTARGIPPPVMPLISISRLSFAMARNCAVSCSPASRASAIRSFERRGGALKPFGHVRFHPPALSSSFGATYRRSSSWWLSPAVKPDHVGRRRGARRPPRCRRAGGSRRRRRETSPRDRDGTPRSRSQGTRPRRQSPPARNCRRPRSITSAKSALA